MKPQFTDDSRGTGPFLTFLWVQAGIPVNNLATLCLLTWDLFSWHPGCHPDSSTMAALQQKGQELVQPTRLDVSAVPG